MLGKCFAAHLQPDVACVGDRWMIPEGEQKLFELYAREKALGAFPAGEFPRMIDELQATEDAGDATKVTLRLPAIQKRRPERRCQR